MNQMKRLLRDDPEFARAAMTFLVIVILGFVYKPWGTQEMDSFLDDIAQWMSFLSTSYTFLKILASIFFVGILDTFEMFWYGVASASDDNFYSIGLFFSVLALISLQQIIERKTMHRVYFSNPFKERLYYFFVGNNNFAIASYLLYFLYPVLYRIITSVSASFGVQEFVMPILLTLLGILSVPAFFYLGAYTVCWLLSMRVLDTINNMMTMNLFLRGIILLVLCIIFSFLINLIAEKVEKFTWSYIFLHIPFLSFLDPLDE